MEVDASNVGVGAILSQVLAGDTKVHPCAFYSHRLSPGRTKLWHQKQGTARHQTGAGGVATGLEGTPVPFQVWTDHKNLEYLQIAKKLNSRQAGWPLFFSRFIFHLAYRPGSKNVKPDALSRYFKTPTREANPDTILRPEVFVHAIEMDIQRFVQQGDDAAPSNCPEGRLYVPACTRSQVLEWEHSSQLSGHPGTGHTITFIQCKFWWPEMREDIQNFVSACSVCAQASVTHQPPPQGLLQPLPIPHKPWSHIALDTGLPTSNHNTTILTIVDRFSKAVHFVPLTKRPSASETAHLLITHIVRLHGIPMDIVLDGGPQFSVRFWKALCTLLGTLVSLSSGFHPQSNGQTEQANQFMKTVLRCLCSNNQGFLGFPATIGRVCH